MGLQRKRWNNENWRRLMEKNSSNIILRFLNREFSLPNLLQWSLSILLLTRRGEFEVAGRVRNHSVRPTTINMANLLSGWLIMESPRVYESTQLSVVEFFPPGFTLTSHFLVSDEFAFEDRRGSLRKMPPVQPRIAEKLFIIKNKGDELVRRLAHIKQQVNEVRSF